jgi:hypothetical protein
MNTVAHNRNGKLQGRRGEGNAKAKAQRGEFKGGENHIRPIHHRILT